MQLDEDPLVTKVTKVKHLTWSVTPGQSFHASSTLQSHVPYPSRWLCDINQHHSLCHRIQAIISLEEADTAGQIVVSAVDTSSERNHCLKRWHHECNFCSILLSLVITFTIPANHIHIPVPPSPNERSSHHRQGNIVVRDGHLSNVLSVEGGKKEAWLGFSHE